MAVSLGVGENELRELTRLATTYALAHGLSYLPVGDVQPPTPTSAIHAPLAILPTCFPRSKFVLAQQLQPLYNVLYARVATDEKFLDEVMGGVEGVGKVDRFTGQLWTCWKRSRDEGIEQVRGGTSWNTYSDVCRAGTWVCLGRITSFTIRAAVTRFR
jgi:glutathione synthase